MPRGRLAWSVLGVRWSMLSLRAFPLVMALSLAGLGALSPSSASAQAARKMTLPEALAFAQKNNLRLMVAQKRLAALQKDSEVPGAQWLPRLGAFAEVVGATTNNSTTTLLNSSTVDIPRVGATGVRGTPSFQPYASTAVALGIRQELYDFGRIAAERAALELVTEAEKYNVQNTNLDVRLAVEQAYYAVLAAVQIEEASHNAYTRAVVHRDTARANVQSGMRPPIELTRAEADVARYEAGMMRAAGNLHIARGVFAATVGTDDAELDAMPATDRPQELASLPDVLRHASGSPVVRFSQARLEAQRGETRRLEAQTRPNLSATAAIDSRAGGASPSSGPTPTGDGWVPVVPNYDVGMILSWPILEPTWGRRADASRAREAAIGEESQYLLRNQRAAIVGAWHEADIAHRSLAALQRGADAARANYDQAENRFRVGLGTSTELADAQALRTESDIQLAIGQFQMARTRAALERVAAEVP